MKTEIALNLAVLFANGALILLPATSTPATLGKDDRGGRSSPTTERSPTGSGPTAVRASGLALAADCAAVAARETAQLQALEKIAALHLDLRDAFASSIQENPGAEAQLTSALRAFGFRPDELRVTCRDDVCRTVLPNNPGDSRLHDDFRRSEWVRANVQQVGSRTIDGVRSLVTRIVPPEANGARFL